MADNQVAIIESTGEIVAQRNEFREVNTISGDSWDERMLATAAVNDADSLADHMGETIRLKNLIVQTVILTEDPLPGETEGKKVAAPRTVLITEDGKAYASVSKGVYNSAMTFLDGLGHPSTWPAALEVHAVRVGKGQSQFFKLAFGAAPKK